MFIWRGACNNLKSIEMAKNNNNTQNQLLERLKHIYTNGMGLSWDKEFAHIEFDRKLDIEDMPTLGPASCQKKWLLESIANIKKDTEEQLAYFGATNVSSELQVQEIIRLKSDLRIFWLKKEILKTEKQI